jgi:hypothetical protein
MRTALMIVSRLIAVAVALVAFYFAFCLYETEEGQWQNRLEGLWFSIYDRAKVTDSTTVALFNRLGTILEKFFRRVFGKRMVSFRAFGISINLSLACGILSIRICPWIAGNYLKDAVDVRVIFGGVFLFGVLAAIGIVFQRPWSTLVVNLPTIFAFVPLVGYIRHVNAPSAGERALALESFSNLASYGLSFFTDFATVIIVRRTVSGLSKALIVSRLILAIGFLAALSGLVEFGPLIFAFSALPAGISVGTQALVRAQGPILQRLNLSSSILCLVPLFLLLVVLVHRLLWPTLSRLLYPVASRKLITNRKVLISIGSLAILYALGIEEVGIKALVNLLGGGSE